MSLELTFKLSTILRYLEVKYNEKIADEISLSIITFQLAKIEKEIEDED